MIRARAARRQAPVQTIPSPPKELIHEYLRCLQKSSIRGPPGELVTDWQTDGTQMSMFCSALFVSISIRRKCPRLLDGHPQWHVRIEYHRVRSRSEQFLRWRSLRHGELFVRSFGCVTHFDEHGSLVGTLQRFCQPDGNWAITQSPDVQCRSCFGDGRPVKVDAVHLVDVFLHHFSSNF